MEYKNVISGCISFSKACLISLTFHPIYLTLNPPFSHSDQYICHNIKFRPVHSSNKGCFFYYLYKILANSADPDETARMSRLIWIYTVCKPCPLQRSLGLKGLMHLLDANTISYSDSSRAILTV